MIHPAPTNKIDPSLSRGTLESVDGTTVVIALPNTSYQIQLTSTAPTHGEIGKRIIGSIHANARRVDIVDTGGKYFEPVFGHPRRIQGRVQSHSVDTNTIVVDAGTPIHCKLTDPRQSPAQFPIGSLVSFDVRDGATFTPQ